MSEPLSPPFWETTPLAEMTEDEWESLCDGCGRCCLIKIEDAETGVFHMTSIACRHLDDNTCRCRHYRERHLCAPGCIALTPETVDRYPWLPETCAYRLVAEGKPLPEWHPLVSKDPGSVHRAGISIRHRTISEKYVHPDCLEAYLVLPDDQQEP